MGIHEIISEESPTQHELQKQTTHHPLPWPVLGGYPITLRSQKGSPAFSPSNKSIGPPSANAMPCMIVFPSSNQFPIEQCHVSTTTDYRHVDTTTSCCRVVNTLIAISSIEQVGYLVINIHKRK